MFELEAKMITLRNKAEAYGLPEPEILKKDRDKLEEIAKRVGRNYSWILMCFIYQKKPQGDAEFFEVSYLTSRL